MSLFNCVTRSLMLSTLLVSSLNAASSFPRGCEVSGFGYDQSNLILNESGEQSYYLIQNRSDAKIELERHDTADAFMSPPLLASLDSMNWAAFASDVKNVNFKCYKRMDDNTSLVDCRDVLEICQYPRVRFALSNMGNYWISVNKSQANVIQDSVAKGIYLKW
ncbi:enhanced entry protein EnhB [Legionella sp. km772]|uniref:enhanced entry protein EnhB n=1 Tax=Legionella sp. km772 TaxID=2498111 RepID=UPI000F8D5791|nr:enhanced entry protein EnhB [Legionella sp. km772]RUR13214.1 enhanced entry protein EnhB [Legionella sp. km772]